MKKRYGRIDELTPELVQLFILRIEIWERSVKYFHCATQEVKIIYNDIGAMDSPMQQGEEQPRISPIITNFAELKSAV